MAKKIEDFTVTSLEQQVWFQKLNHDFPLTPSMILHHQKIQLLLKQVNASLETNQTARYLSWMENYPDAQPILKTHLSSPSWSLLARWYELFQMTVIPAAGTSQTGVARSLKLRRLMREAYLNLELVLLTVADHGARAEIAYTESQKENYWRDTEIIFLPLLQMLGLWALRREWVEQTAKFLYPKDFSSLNERLERSYSDQKICVQQIQTHLDRQLGIGLAKCELRKPVPGRIIYRSQHGESPEELSEIITITVFTKDRSHCYLLLESIHQLGLPVMGRFADYIANPNANGYRAIHTTIIGNDRNLSCNHKLIAFRITTREMHEINMWGRLGTNNNYSDSSQRQVLPWQQTRDLDEIRTLLEIYDIGAPTNLDKEKIYVFTPLGEVKCLNRGSTGLDFAYDLHTKLGHHCRSVMVNGQKVSHATELHNGDLVFLEHDPLFQGPDPAWLHIAKNPRTRQKIKQGLRAIRQSVHAGRQHIARYLDALEKDSGFVVPEAQLEKYFSMVVDELGLTNVNSLFQAITPDSQNHDNKIASEKIIAFILESELTSAVVNKTGDRLVSDKNFQPSFHNAPLQFCPNCKPAPGAPLILHRKKRQDVEKLTLHRKTLPHPKNKEINKGQSLFGLPSPYRISCLNGINPDELDENVKWGEVNLSREASNITILARDRTYLIGDLLKPIYDDNRINLTYVQASADSEGMATVQFTVESDTIKQVKILKEGFDKVPNIIDSSIWPVTLSQSAHYKTRITGKIEIPYTPGPVREQRMLFGRDDEIWKLKNWLEGSQPESLIILVGQPRSGKTSLAKLTRSYLRGRIRPIYINLQQITRDLTEANIYWLIMEEIYREIKSTISPSIPEADYRPPTEDQLQQNPNQEFFTYLRNIQDLVSPQRILLILDEFNILTNEYSSSLLFSELRPLTLGDFPGITLMLVTHTSQYYELPTEHEAYTLFAQGVKLDLPMLDQISARKLIQEPLRLNMQFDEAVVNQIVDSTNGHPYIINLLCRDIVDHVLQSGRVLARTEDLQIAVQTLIRNGNSSFKFLINKVDEGLRPLMLQVAINQYEGSRWVDVSELAKQSNLSAAEIVNALDYLERHGVLSTRKDRESNITHVRILVEYFCQWILRNWS